MVICWWLYYEHGPIIKDYTHLQQQILECQWTCLTTLQSMTRQSHSEYGEILQPSRHCTGSVDLWKLIHFGNKLYQLWSDSSARHLDEWSGLWRVPSVVRKNFMPHSNGVLNIGTVKVLKHNAWQVRNKHLLMNETYSVCHTSFIYNSYVILDHHAIKICHTNSSPKTARCFCCFHCC